MKIQEMGVLPLLPSLLNPQSSCTPKVANIIAEVAKNGEVCFPCPSVHLFFACFALTLELFGGKCISQVSYGRFRFSESDLHDCSFQTGASFSVTPLHFRAKASLPC